MAQTIETSSEETKKPSMMAMVIPLAVITLVAGGAGFGVGTAFLQPVAPSAAPAEGKAAPAKKATPDKDASKTDAHEEKEAHPPKKTVVAEVPAITTNLADPSDAWIRLEVALVYTGDADETLSQEVHQDIVAFVRTLRLYNLRGGSGYRHLVEDLEDRARIRSEGRIERVLIRSLVIE